LRPPVASCVLVDRPEAADLPGPAAPLDLGVRAPPAAFLNIRAPGRFDLSGRVRYHYENGESPRSPVSVNWLSPGSRWCICIG